MFPYILGGLLLPLLMVLVTRITEKPIRIRAIVTESAANTYTEQSIALPVTAFLTGRGKSGKAQAIELMKVFSDIPTPELEAGQNNQTQVQLVKDTTTGSLDYNSENFIWGRKKRVHELQGAAGEAAIHSDEMWVDDMTDGDGNGEILTDQTIYLGLKGTGNASAQSSRVALLCHLVELDSADVVAQLASNDD